MALFQIRKSVPYVAEALIRSVDNRRNFSLLHQIPEQRQVLVVELINEKTELLACEFRHQRRGKGSEQMFQCILVPPRSAEAGEDANAIWS